MRAWRAVEAVPVWRTPRRPSARRVVAIPCAPRSTEWFDAVLHASNPAQRIAPASSGGELKRG